MPELFEPKPRWPGAPPICLATNLLAHESESAVLRFLKSICMDGNLKKMGQCKVCGKWHHVCKPIDPSGTTSGDKVKRGDSCLPVIERPTGKLQYGTKEQPLKINWKKIAEECKKRGIKRNHHENDENR